MAEKNKGIERDLEEAEDYSHRNMYRAARHHAEEAVRNARLTYGEDALEYADVLKRAEPIFTADEGYDLSGPMLEIALKIEERALGPDHPDLVETLYRLAKLHRTQDRAEMAAAMLTRALAIREEVTGPLFPDADTILDELTDLRGGEGRIEEITRIYRDKLKAAKEMRDERARGLVERWIGRADAYAASTPPRHEEALVAYAAALTLHERLHGPEDTALAAVLTRYADVYGKLGRAEEAAPLRERARAIKEERAGPGTAGSGLPAGRAVTEKLPETAKALADEYRAQGRYDEAEPVLNRALEIARKHHDPKEGTYAEAASVHAALGRLYEGLDRPADAETHFQTALAILEDVAPGSPDRWEAMEDLARVQTARGQYDSAEVLLQTSRELREAAAARDKQAE